MSCVRSRWPWPTPASRMTSSPPSPASCKRLRCLANRSGLAHPLHTPHLIPPATAIVLPPQGWNITGAGGTFRPAAASFGAVRGPHCQLFTSGAASPTCGGPSSQPLSQEEPLPFPFSGDQALFLRNGASASQARRRPPVDLPRASGALTATAPSHRSLRPWKPRPSTESALRSATDSISPLATVRPSPHRGPNPTFTILRPLPCTDVHPAQAHASPCFPVCVCVCVWDTAIVTVRVGSTVLLQANFTRTSFIPPLVAPLPSLPRPQPHTALASLPASDGPSLPPPPSNAAQASGAIAVVEFLLDTFQGPAAAFVGSAFTLELANAPGPVSQVPHA